MIEVKHIWFSYEQWGEFVLKDISFSVEKGEIVGVLGANGVGKTTTIGKLAHNFKEDGKSVLLAAADTFRAAAIDQLEIWGERSEIPVIKHEENSDPAAVVYDAVHEARKQNTDLLICDTAGRLHNKKNLMQHFFVDASQVSEEIIRIEGTDVNHMKNVLRMRIGEEVTVSDGQGKEYLCKVRDFEEDCACHRERIPCGTQRGIFGAGCHNGTERTAAGKVVSGSDGYHGNCADKAGRHSQGRHCGCN